MPKTRSDAVRSAVGIVGACACFILLSTNFGSKPLRDNLWFFGTLFLIAMPSILWSYLKDADILHCTGENLEIINRFRGKTRRVRTIPRTDVKRICFAPVTYSKYRAIGGLIFAVNGKMEKNLSGLESPEAQKILQQLDRLGYDVVLDPSMTMMVEMALERRKSIFR